MKGTLADLVQKITTEVLSPLRTATNRPHVGLKFTGTCDLRDSRANARNRITGIIAIILTTASRNGVIMTSDATLPTTGSHKTWKGCQYWTSARGADRSLPFLSNPVPM
jgi:hypothetical protein